MSRRRCRITLAIALTLATGFVIDLAPGRPAVASGTWPWPVTGPVLQAFDPPLSPFGSGHRGIDIAAPLGTPVLAPARGTVTFAGPVGGHLFLTIDHGGGVESTYSWLASISVRRGDQVAAGQAVATTGAGHPGEPVTHLHLGVKLADVYVDPLDYLEPISLSGFIWLAPLAPM
jgi:murein DD-endopeptidase MepM/ murein hydrolase activator NlpD